MAEYSPAEDPRLELVQRIITSPLFSKSERLSSFLTTVCRLCLDGQSDEINEQRIGVTVFGRKADYDTTVDGIVRTHATRLRIKLAQYFREYGGDETLVVEIPPGSYVPIFTRRGSSLSALSSQSVSELSAVHRLPSGAAVNSASASVTDEVVRPGKTTRIRRIATGCAFAWMALSIVYLATHTKLATDIWAEWKGAHHPLWSTMFNKNNDTLVVSGDIGLMNFEIETDRPVMLGEYSRNNYVNQYMAQFALESFSPASSLFLTKSMTVVDSKFIERLFRLPGIDLDRTTFSSARDVQLPNLQSGNIVLLGNFRLNPWVQAFEPKMNFYFTDSRSALTQSILMNRSPRGSEQASYYSTDIDHVHTEYSVVAFEPNLNGSGNVLLLEGQSELSTEAAAKFVENDADLIPFLNKIREKDGGIAHFEVLLRAKGMSGNVASFEMLAYRVDK